MRNGDTGQGPAGTEGSARKNIFAFHGADAKVGVTMTAQCVAELLAEGLPEGQILFLSAGGGPNREYQHEETVGIDDFRAELESGLEIGTELLRPTKKRNNLYRIAGAENEPEERRYRPETAAAMVTALGRRFDAVIADTGSTPDNGLALGVLQAADWRGMILTQSESTLKRYERLQGVYGQLQIDFQRYFFNRFREEDPYAVRYLCRRLALEEAAVGKLTETEYGVRAEREEKSLLEFRGEKYRADVAAAADILLRLLGRGESAGKKGRRAYGKR